LTPSTAQSTRRTLGQQTRRLGAVGFITGGARRQQLRCPSCRRRCRSCHQFSRSCHQFSRLCQRDLQIHTIAPMASRIGKQGGRYRKKSGAVGSMAKVAPTRAAGARHLRSLTIAMLGLPIGRLDGAFRRSLGAVPTRARAAPQQLEDVLELDLDGLFWPWRWPRGPSSGATGRTSPLDSSPARMNTALQRRL